MIRVQYLEWDEENEEYVWRHRLTPNSADRVLHNRPIFVPNKRRRAGTHLMIGPDESGQFWTVSLRPTGTPGVWRPITGYPSSRGENARHNQVNLSGGPQDDTEEDDEGGTPDQ
jgi:hypothetical protein